jgi:hypothetical protein
MAKLPKQNPVVNSAREAARNHINGYEEGIDEFNEFAAKRLRDGDPEAINIVRNSRKNIRDARNELGLDEE